MALVSTRAAALAAALPLCLGVALQTQALARSPAGAVAAADTLHARVDALFAEWDRPDSPGAAVAVVRDGELLYARGYGSANLEYGIPIGPSTVFHVASVSKHLTAFAVHLLAEEGRLSLDDDVRSHVPELADFGARITLRHLIHHTSGLRDQWELLAISGWRLDDVITQDHILKTLVLQRELNFAPGAEHLYSNSGYTLLALVVERVTGQPLREFAEERIFRPLGMTSTHFHDDHERIVPNRAYSYAPAAGGGFRSAPLNYANVGATSLFTTVEDLARWDRNFVEPRVGSRALLERMHEQGVLDGGERIAYAHALSIGEHRGLRTVGHSGADAGYRAYFLRFPDQGYTFVVLSNLASMNPVRLAQQMAEIYLRDELAAPAAPARRAEPAARPARLSAGEMHRLAGLYVSPRTDALRRLEVRDGSLRLAVGPGYDLTPLGAGRFLVAGAPVRTEIRFEGSGSLTRLRESAEGGSTDLYEPAVRPARAELAAFEGTYHSDELGTSYTLRVREGRLVAEHRRHEDATLVPTLTDRFAGDRWWLRTLRFQRDEAGAVTGFSLSGGRVRNLRFERVGG
jgi:CubicO group peptidase (beta-lactamase class C family)